MEDFRKFYYECALTDSDSGLLALHALVGSDRILFGTDFPAVSTETAMHVTAQNDLFYAKVDYPGWMNVMRGNALKLMPRIKDVLPVTNKAVPPSPYRRLVEQFRGI